MNFGRKFAIEIHPVHWRFTAEKSWIAGWIRPEADQKITDVRARLHHRVILGLAGLPHPASMENGLGAPDASGAGFSFLLCPQPNATLLRLEVRDQTGRWSEFFRTKISADPQAAVPTTTPGLINALGRLTTLLLKHHLREPERTWTDLADTLLAAFVAEPLHAHPNAPFTGALEEPHDIGRLRYGRIPVTGWLTHATTKITRLSAIIDPLPDITLPHGLMRHDISGTHSFADRTHSAFVGEIALPLELAAPVLLKIFAELDNGEKHLVFARRFTPQLHGANGAMPPLVAGLTFSRAIWALHHSAGRYKLPRHGLIRAARTLWDDYRALPAYRPKKNPPLHVSFAPQNQSSSFRLEPDCTKIAPADDMCVPDAKQYFHIGREALLLVRQAAAQAGCQPVEAILDLPSGYGRVARWFRTEFPTARLTVCDTLAPGVSFCVEHLGANGVHAAVDGSHWATLPGPYDIIWCGSLLTHFDRAQWIEHLCRFNERLSPHGVLVFTSHGLPALEQLHCGKKDYGLPPPEVARLATDAVAQGFGYVDYPDTPGYGISMAQPGWIDELIAEETDLHLLAYLTAAWDQHQDVIVCTRRAPPKRFPLWEK